MIIIAVPILHYLAKVLGACGTSPVLPCCLVLYVTVRTSDVQVFNSICALLFHAALETASCQYLQPTYVHLHALHVPCMLWQAVMHSSDTLIHCKYPRLHMLVVQCLCRLSKSPEHDQCNMHLACLGKLCCKAMTLMW